MRRPGGEPLRCRGVNWYGFEGETRAAHGPWTGRDYRALMADVAEQGFNCLRVPVGPESIRAEAIYPPAGWAAGWGRTGSAVLRAFLEAARDEGLVVALSFHSYHPELQGEDLPGRPWGALPGGGAYTPGDWLADLEALAELTRGLPNVAMIGLCNEPYAMGWAAWADAAEEGAAAVLRGNPELLVSVAGVGGTAARAGGYEVNWGANLAGVDPQDLDIPADKLIFEVHLYPPGAHRLSYHRPGADYEAAWRTQWGHLAESGYAVMIGEVGGAFATREDREWARQLGAYATWAGVESAFAWCLNPTSGWDEGLLVSNDTWRGWHLHKLSALEPVLPDL